MKRRRGGYNITKLNGKPLSRRMHGLMLGEVRRLFRYRAAERGLFPSDTEVDDAIWTTLETGRMPEMFQTLTKH
jgi:hypothetical protein